MPSTLPILRARRERRLAKQHASDSRKRSLFVSAGMILSLIVAALIIIIAFAYVNLTRDLPSIQTLPILLNPPNGLLLQPTKIYDRTREHVLFTFAPDDSPRRYIPLSDTNPQHLSQSLADAVIATFDPTFYDHSGYSLNSITNYELHDTLAQKLVSDLLLFNEPPSFRRALRERILAAQVTSQFGRAQILEWYLNSAHFGRYAFGAESAAQLYFGKSATQLTTAESAILAAVSDSPSLNPHDAPQIALERGRETIRKMSALGFLSDEATANALGESPLFQPPPPSDVHFAAAFVNLLLAQLDSQFPRARIERGGLTIISTLDFNVQEQSSCVTAFYAARLAGLRDPSIQCDSLRFLSALPPSITIPDSSASAIITDPATGQVLAAVGETFEGRETPLIGAHRPGSALDAFVYLTGFTRGLSPASLVWDIPGKTDIQNFDGAYHGPIRLRTALVNDYPAPAAQVMSQMGIENVDSIMSSFGVAHNVDLSLLNAASAYGVFAERGVHFGQSINDKFTSVTILKVEGYDDSVWLDWTTPQAKPVVTPALAYLLNHSLSDESARVDNSSAFNVGRPAAVMLGQTADSLDAWTIGYSPLRVVAVWAGSRESNNLSPRISSVLWNALMQIASQNLSAEDWSLPEGVSVINVCDPSGMLPTSECPNVVNEVFLQGNEPVQADNMYRKYAINRETGLLATVFTLPQLIEERVYLVVPSDARSWAESAGVAIPPSAYDVIQAPPTNPDVNITFPELFAEVGGVVQVNGTAAGADFASYRVLIGQGLNPQEWIQIGEGNVPVTNGLLAEWNTEGLSGLYAVQLQVVRTDQRVDSAVVQVTVK
ncbi:MAG TPA: transglycosylase domain-containing protein [Anaerolineales bacterium]|nr:transglycosylase domain-containing protein [Anaerolineales bacterium]HNQ93036.1 transglycosylase domain-containing protein [Anaerolineales bacterium]HNS60378.1 transglycosylase domain-containing protein [Anaerolineales bacterium]